MPRSLRARMLWSLLAVILLGALVQGAVAYRSALHEANLLFDYNMQQMALSLRSGIPLANRGGPPELDNFNDFDFVVQVWTVDGIRIFESSPSLILPQRAVLGFSTVRTSRADYRVYSTQTNTRVIQVAQDLGARTRLAGGLALRTVAPIALIVPLLMLVTWWVVTKSLRPVERVRSQVARRAADDLSPVNADDLPDEVQPLVEEVAQVDQQPHQQHHQGADGLAVTDPLCRRIDESFHIAGFTHDFCKPSGGDHDKTDHRHHLHAFGK